MKYKVWDKVVIRWDMELNEKFNWPYDPWLNTQMLDMWLKIVEIDKIYCDDFYFIICDAWRSSCQRIDKMFIWKFNENISNKNVECESIKEIRDVMIKLKKKWYIRIDWEKIQIDRISFEWDLPLICTGIYDGKQKVQYKIKSWNEELKTISYKDFLDLYNDNKYTFNIKIK